METTHPQEMRTQVMRTQVMQTQATQTQATQTQAITQQDPVVMPLQEADVKIQHPEIPKILIPEVRQVITEAVLEI